MNREHVCNSNNGILYTIVGLLKIATWYLAEWITQSTNDPPCFRVGWGLFLVHANAVYDQKLCLWSHLTAALDFHWSSGAASCALFLGTASFMWRSNKVAIEAASSWFAKNHLTCATLWPCASNNLNRSSSISPSRWTTNEFYMLANTIFIPDILKNNNRVISNTKNRTTELKQWTLLRTGITQDGTFSQVMYYE